MVENKIIFTVKHQLIVLLLLAIGLNINTLFNAYALDDGVVLTENSLVEKGIKGIPEILTTEIFHGFKGEGSAGLSEGRYRPFALVIFALEYQFFGANPFVSHLINILLFALLIIMLYNLLRSHIFRERKDYLAFVSCLLFAVHPIHTEVIANIKSRDEIITFILLIASLVSLIKYHEKNTIRNLLIGLLYFFLALLTRESAVTFLAVVPLILYFFFRQTVLKSLRLCIPLGVLLIVYLALRISIVGISHSSGLDVLNSPFLYATASQAFATKVFILLKYLGLLLFPFPLSFDYGYNQIPYIDLGSLQFIFSIALWVGLLTYAAFTFKKKTILSFCILYFLATISLVSNFVVDVGTPLSERFLFQPSLAFCIAIAALYFRMVNRSTRVVNGILFILLILFSVKTYLRNQDWKNNETLDLTDVISSPNSVRTNQYALELYILKANAETNIELKKDYFKKAVYHGERTVKIYPNNPVAYMELGSAYYGLSDYFKTADLWIQTFKLIPDDPKAKYWVEFLSNFLYKKGNELYEKGEIDEAIKYYKKSTELNNKNVEAWYHLGGCYFLKDDTKNAVNAWAIVFNLDPKHSFKKEEFSKY